MKRNTKPLSYAKFGKGFSPFVNPALPLSLPGNPSLSLPGLTGQSRGNY